MEDKNEGKFEFRRDRQREIGGERERENDGNLSSRDID